MTDPDILNERSTWSEYADVAPTVFGHPDDVLEDAALTVDQKRAVLASWASDANAVPHLPALRQLPDGSIVPVADILRALKALDVPDEATRGGWRPAMSWATPFRRRKATHRLFDYRKDADDDDDPPPCPAIAAARPRRGGGGALVPPDAVAA